MERLTFFSKALIALTLGAILAFFARQTDLSYYLSNIVIGAISIVLASGVVVGFVKAIQKNR